MLGAAHKMTETTQWGIRAFAEMFDVTPRTIRFYEDKGLLSPKRQAGSRVFSPKDYVRFEKIMRGKRLGFSLDDIKEVMEVTDGNVTDRAELIRRRKNFETVINSLQRRRDDIDALSNDMTEICNVIDDYMSDTSHRDGVFDLASAYEAKLRQTLYEGNAANDYATEISET